MLSLSRFLCVYRLINSDNNNNHNHNHNHSEGCMRNTKEGRTPFLRSLKSSLKRHRVCSRKHLIDIRPNSSGKNY